MEEEFTLLIGKMVETQRVVKNKDSMKVSRLTISIYFEFCDQNLALAPD